MIKLENGKEYLYQWNTQQRAFTDYPAGTKFDFAQSGTDVLERTAYALGSQTVVDIPNALLQLAGTLYVYAHKTVDGQLTTVLEASITVRGQPRPRNYVNDEQEIQLWNSLEERIIELEKGGAGSGGGPSDAVRYGEPQELTDEQKEQARNNIGAGSVVDISGQVQKAETAAQNAAGSAKAAAGVEDRLNQELELIERIEVTEENAGANFIEKTQAPDGTPYDFTAFYFILHIPRIPNRDGVVDEVTALLLCENSDPSATGVNGHEIPMTYPNMSVESASHPRTAYVYLERRNGMMRGDVSIVYEERGTKQVLGGPVANLFQFQAVTGFRVTSENVGLEVGTYIEVYGRK